MSPACLAFTLLLFAISHVSAVILPANCPNKTQEYLTQYGYLDPNKECITEDILAALRKFQEMNINFEGLKVTGQCDETMVKVMFMPRCGCEDIEKGQKKMMPQNIYGPLEYRTGSKWTKKHLEWIVSKYPRRNRFTPQAVDDAMRRGLQIWADQTMLTFAQAASEAEADIKIRFEIRRHTSRAPYYDFDGAGNVLVHAFFPESGVVHFDDEENFVLGSNNSGTELYIVAAHAFGHTLGIKHSNIEKALMAPYYRYSEQLELHSDDIRAIQSLYGPSDKAPTARPVTLEPTAAPTQKPNVPSYCNEQVQASFKIDDIVYIFTREMIGRYKKTMVYQVCESRGIDTRTRTPINKMFGSRNQRQRYPRAYPFRVDAAAYIPNKNYIFVFSGTRAYRYTARKIQGSVQGPFTLDDGFPLWMNVKEFPERPRAAVAMPYSNYNSYYMLIFGTTMVWDWNFNIDRVGAWAYPIDAFGRNMPQRVDAAYLNNKEQAIFLKGDNYYEFSIRYRRIEETTNVKSVKTTLMKGDCM